VRGADDLIDKVRKCWSSLFTPRAIFYRNEKGFPHEKVFISVGVQKMVNSGCAGVMFTINPVTGNRDEIVIEGNYGLGETVVSGAVNPDDFVVDKATTTIKERRISRKTVQYIRDPKTGKTVPRYSSGKAESNLHRRPRTLGACRTCKKIEKRTTVSPWILDGQLTKIYLIHRTCS
jgi:pyruvate,water dikinase